MLVTNETIQSLIDALNAGCASGVYLRPIAENVWWGFVWEPIPKEPEKHSQEMGYEMFFVQAAESEFAAAVLWHGSNELHWYVTDKHRRKHLLVEPLKTVILPFIFNRHKCKKQSCSVESRIEHKTASIRLAKRVGFRKVGSNREKTLFEIQAEEIAPFQKHPQPTPSLADLEQLKAEAELSIRSLRMVIDNLRVRFGELADEEELENWRAEFEGDVVYGVRECIEKARWSLKPDGGGVS